MVISLGLHSRFDAPFEYPMVLHYELARYRPLPIRNGQSWRKMKLR